MKGVSLGSVALMLAALVVAPSPGLAADPTGTWLSQDGESKLRITRCGDAICGNLA